MYEHTRTRWVWSLAVLALVAAACGGTTDVAEPPQTSPAPAPGTQAAPDLGSVCPNPIVLQDNWIPQSTEGYFYGLIAPEERQLNTDTFAVFGPAKADPNVTVEIRHGGPAAGFQSTQTLLYANPEILLAGGNMDSMIELSREFPTIAVFAPNIKHPFALTYGKEAFPDIRSFEDIKASGATVLVAEHQTYARALVALGALDEAQVDFSYDFSPARFIEADGKIFETGFGDLTPYQYLYEVEEWGGRPVDALYVADGGYPNYRVVFARRDAITENAECFRRLVPAIQQAWVDYLTDPWTTHRQVVEWNETMDAYTYSVEVFDNAVNAAFEDGLIENGPSGYIGEIEEEKVARLLEIAGPVLEESGAQVDPNLTAQDLFTNEFMDSSIQAPSQAPSP